MVLIEEVLRTVVVPIELEVVMLVSGLRLPILFENSRFPNPVAVNPNPPLIVPFNLNV